MRNEVFRNCAVIARTEMRNEERMPLGKSSLRKLRAIIASPTAHSLRNKGARTQGRPDPERGGLKKQRRQTLSRLEPAGDVPSAGAETDVFLIRVVAEAKQAAREARPHSSVASERLALAIGGSPAGCRRGLVFTRVSV